MTESLVAEYEGIIAALGESPTDDQIVAALVREGGWTDKGAHDVLRLARSFGASILRNALALANAMRIEDGDSGL
jgi:hypothetical protein